MERLREGGDFRAIALCDLEFLNDLLPGFPGSNDKRHGFARRMAPLDACERFSAAEFQREVCQRQGSLVRVAVRPFPRWPVDRHAGDCFKIVHITR